MFGRSTFLILFIAGWTGFVACSARRVLVAESGAENHFVDVEAMPLCIALHGVKQHDIAADLLVRGVFGVLAEEAGADLVFGCDPSYRSRLDVFVGAGRRPLVLIGPVPGGFMAGPGSAVHWAKELFVGVRRVFKLSEKDRAKLKAKLRKPLFPGASYNRKQLYTAFFAGLEWLIHGALAGNAGQLSDYLQIFYILQESAASGTLRNIGREMGQMLSERYKKLVKPPDYDTAAPVLYDAAAGLYLLRALGRSHEHLRKALHGVFARASLENRIPGMDASWKYSALGVLDALVDLYFIYRLGFPCSVPYEKIVERALQWELKEQNVLDNDEFDIQTYLVTHVIYVLSDFNLRELDPGFLSVEEEYMTRHLDYYMSIRDVETVGEFGDSLKILGRGYENSAVRKIVSSLLSWQNEDGSWGDVNEKSEYVRYHSTWTAFNGILEFEFSGKGPESAWMNRLLEKRAVEDTGGNLMHNFERRLIPDLLQLSAPANCTSSELLQRVTVKFWTTCPRW